MAMSLGGESYFSHVSEKRKLKATTESMVSVENKKYNQIGIDGQPVDLMFFLLVHNECISSVVCV